MSPNLDRRRRRRVTLELDREILEEIVDMARGDGIDGAELVPRLLAAGLRHQRMKIAIDDYAVGRRSAWSAAQVAGVSLYEMLDRINDAGIAYRLDPEVLSRS